MAKPRGRKQASVKKSTKPKRVIKSKQTKPKSRPKTKVEKPFKAEEKLKSFQSGVRQSVSAVDSLCKTVDDVVPPDIQEAGVNAVQGWIGGITGMGVGLLMKGKKKLCSKASVMSKSY